MPGSWSYQPYLQPYDYYIFYSAIGQQDYYSYLPIAAASQVVNGMNYKFIAIAEPITADGSPHFAVIETSQSSDGTISPASIVPVE
ncbi:hypothetical protein GPL15_08590 [Clostridium sp. MCC353]|uniref:hypothetical protein n=1 Tax=Clostridium sp. MCC353 TaxID=2592646 RepID=UPI001C02B577|nr:hypothetical protein [Clostridium sp. MCC353]MBT9776560.1 hypothetical protein [Clostridium sp. MCC353]